MNFKKLLAYQKAYELAMKIFETTKSFPKEERYSLTDQIRRCSRSVCTNIAEGYRKRRYTAHFISKLSDADMENSETSVWLDFSNSCKYLDDQTHLAYLQANAEVGRLLENMMNNPEHFQ